MKSFWIVFLVSVFFIAPPLFAFAPTSTGKELLEYCKIAMDVSDKQYWKPQTEPEYILGAKTGICEGYLMSATERRLQSRVQLFCLPPDYNLLVGASAVVQYLKAHPEQENLSASFLVTRSLETYFPCIRRG